MTKSFDVENCFSFINCNLQPGSVSFDTSAPKRAVTISRQSGCGAHAIAKMLAEYLQGHSPKGAPPWTVFDHNLVEKVLEDHQLPERFARFMPEDSVTLVNDTMDQLFGLHPPTSALVEQTCKTILRLAELGSVIIVGRGANIVTASLPQVVHVRLVGSLERRIANMQHFEGLTEKAAAERVHREDAGRHRYVKQNFHKNVDDPLLSHLVINTDFVSPNDAARIIGDLALRHELVPA
jgi:cytidylate kinase